MRDERGALELKQGKPVAAISDESLWQLIGWHPGSQQDRAKIFLGLGGAGWWGSHFVHEKRPSCAWIDWAKTQVVDHEVVAQLGCCGTPTQVYLCRLMRILETFHRETWCSKKAVEEEFLRAAVASGLALSGGDVTSSLTWHARRIIADARDKGFVTAYNQQELDATVEEEPGQDVPTIWKRYCRLTLAGYRLAEVKDEAVPPEVFPVEAAESPPGADTPGLSAQPIPPDENEVVFTPYLERDPETRVLVFHPSAEVVISLATPKHNRAMEGAEIFRRLAECETWIEEKRLPMDALAEGNTPDAAYNGIKRVRECLGDRADAFLPPPTKTGTYGLKQPVRMRQTA